MSPFGYKFHRCAVLVDIQFHRHGAVNLLRIVKIDKAQPLNALKITGTGKHGQIFVIRWVGFADVFEYGVEFVPQVVMLCEYTVILMSRNCRDTCPNAN